MPDAPPVTIDELPSKFTRGMPHLLFFVINIVLLAKPQRSGFRLQLWVYERPSVTGQFWVMCLILGHRSRRLAKRVPPLESIHGNSVARKTG